MGFEFEQRPTLEICGNVYDVDLTDTGFVEGVVLDFGAILQEYDTYQQLQQQLLEEGTNEEQVREISQQLTDANRRIAEHGRDFIIRVLGQAAYEEIFSQRRPNSMEHLQLCGYIYQETVRSREELVEGYLEPLNREGRRNAQRAKAAKIPVRRRQGLPGGW